MTRYKQPTDDLKYTGRYRAILTCTSLMARDPEHFFPRCWNNWFLFSALISLTLIKSSLASSVGLSIFLNECVIYDKRLCYPQNKVSFSPPSQQACLSLLHPPHVLTGCSNTACRSRIISSGRPIAEGWEGASRSSPVLMMLVECSSHTLFIWFCSPPFLVGWNVLSWLGAEFNDHMVLHLHC